MADKKSPKTASETGPEAGPEINGAAPPVQDAPPDQNGRNEAMPLQTADLIALDELARLERAPSWLHAAAVRLKGWQPGKTASRQEYREALDALTQRRQGGGKE